MILSRILLIVLTRVSRGRRFATSDRRVFVSLLLTPLLAVSCARSGAVAGNPADPLVYVAVGDSTGIGLGAPDGGGYVDRLFALMKQKRPGSNLINLSVAGATTADAINKQIPQLDGARAALVTICIGMNDLLRGREVRQFADDYETLVGKLSQSGRLIVVVNLPDVASAPAMTATADESLRLRLGQFNQAIEDVAKRHRVQLVDLYKLSAETIASRTEFFSADGLHPSALGYSRWADAMWDVVESAISE